MEDFKLNLDVDTKAILLIFMNDETILRFLTIPTTSPSFDVLQITTTNPSITETKTIGERFNEYFFTTTGQPIFLNWGRLPTVDDEEKGRICLYPGNIGLSNHIAPTDYLIDIFVPYDWHRYDNRGYRLMKRVVELLNDTNIFGNVGKSNGIVARPIFGIEGYVGYQLQFRNQNFVK